MRHLSPRERQVTKLVHQGKANKEIAFELGLTEGTVKIYLTGIMRKAGVTNRTALAIWWEKNGLPPVMEGRGDCANCLLRNAHLVGAEQLLQPTSE